jgi:hypothetical protein
LTPAQIRDLLAKLETVCEQAQELQAQLRQAMVERARADTPNHQGQPERREKARKVR